MFRPISETLIALASNSSARVFAIFLVVTGLLAIALVLLL
jgi:hypothetical protein